MTTEKLKRLTVKDLAAMAKKSGVLGWHSMRKEQLIRSLAGNANPSESRDRASRRVRSTKSRSSADHSGANRSSSASKIAKAKSARIQQRIRQINVDRARLKDLAHRAPLDKPNGYRKDRLLVMVRDAYWLHVYWELTRKGIQRAEAALNQKWHSARPVLRLLEVHGQSTSSAAESVVRQIEVHGGVNNWYIHVEDPPKTYRLDIGYMAPSGQYFVLARSNVVNTPRAGTADAIDENWTDVAANVEKIFALSGGFSPDGSGQELQELFEERLRRPMGSPLLARHGSGARAILGDSRQRKFAFELDAELIIYGGTAPDAHVTLQGDPVELRRDGTFTVRFRLPNCRQVIPAVSSSADGVEQRTIVIAVERNTKIMEPVVRDTHE